MYSAIFTDIDGTLFRSDLSIGQRTRDALREAHRKGLRIVLSSGRYITGMRIAQEQLGIPVIYAAINGALIKDGTNYLRERRIDEDAYRQAASFLHGRVSSLIAFCETRYAIEADEEWYTRQNMICQDIGVRMDISDPERVLEKTGERPYKLLAKDSRQDHLSALMAELEPMLEGKARVISSGWNNIEILPWGIDKSDAISIVSSHLGIKPSETIAFGDWDNDAGMLRAAGLGIAMANASDEAKAAADSITASNDEDGIAVSLSAYGII